MFFYKKLIKIKFNQNDFMNFNYIYNKQYYFNINYKYDYQKLIL